MPRLQRTQGQAKPWAAEKAHPEKFFGGYAAPSPPHSLLSFSCLLWWVDAVISILHMGETEVGD